MKITPIEIKQKVFEKAFRGYEKQEVSAFLASLAKEWELLQTEHKELKQRLEQSQKEVIKLRDMEESLFKTLKTAEDTRSNLIDQANKSAAIQLKEAQMKAETLVSGGRERAKNMIERAENKAMEIVEDAQHQMRDLKQSCAAVAQYRDQLMSDLKILSQDILDKLQRIQQATTATRTPLFTHLKPTLARSARAHNNGEIGKNTSKVLATEAEKTGSEVGKIKPSSKPSQQKQSQDQKQASETATNTSFFEDLS